MKREIIDAFLCEPMDEFGTLKYGRKFQSTGVVEMLENIFLDKVSEERDSLKKAEANSKQISTCLCRI